MGAWSGRPPHTHTGGGAERAAGGGSPAGGAVAEGVPQPAGAVRGPEPGERGKTTLPPPPPPPGPPTPPPTSPLVSCPCSRGCWRSAMLCARPTRSCAVLRCSRAACSRQVSGGPKGGGRGGTAPIRVAAPIKVPVPIRVTVIFLLFVILDSVVSTVAATAMPGTPPRGCHVVCVCVCPPLKLKPYFSPLDALLDGSAAPAGNLAAEILPAELRWVPGGVLEPQCCPTCPDPPPLFHPPPGRQWHGCSRRTSGCRPRRQHYGCRGTDCSSSSVTLTGMGETGGGSQSPPSPGPHFLPFNPPRSSSVTLTDMGETEGVPTVPPHHLVSSFPPL